MKRPSQFSFNKTHKNTIIMKILHSWEKSNHNKGIVWLDIFLGIVKIFQTESRDRHSSLWRWRGSSAKASKLSNFGFPRPEEVSVSVLVEGQEVHQELLMVWGGQLCWGRWGCCLKVSLWFLFSSGKWFSFDRKKYFELSMFWFWIGFFDWRVSVGL